MIERRFIDQKVKDYKVKDYINNRLGKQGYSRCEITKTPLGMKVIIYTSKPGLIVGRGGENIKSLTEVMRTKFKMQSPQIEVREVENPELDANIMAGRVAFQLTRFGVSRFKSIGYRTLQRIILAGATGAEILMAGKVPGKRSKTWRFYGGSLPKCGHISDTEVQIAIQSIKLKSGVVGITVKILPPGIRMPDDVQIKKPDMKVEEVPEEPKKKEKPKEEKKEKPKEEKVKKAPVEKKAPAKEKPKKKGEKVGGTKKVRNKKDE
jgi:small subunit ribosomal protein S3